MPKEKVTPPKKKTGSKTDKKARPNADAAGGLSGEGPIQETRAELLAKIQAVEREAVKANEHRNYMQLERDKIDSFWEITKAELESTKVDLRDAQRELEVAGEQHEMELRLQTHKLKQVKHERLEAESQGSRRVRPGRSTTAGGLSRSTARSNLKNLRRWRRKFARFVASTKIVAED